MTGSIRILIVEDYADIAKIYSVILEKSGYEVRIAKDGKEALSQVLEFRPSVILLDIMIPLIDGLEVLRRVRSEPQYMEINPKILITSNVLQQDISDQAALNGADGYVVKANVNNHELVSIVQELLAQGSDPGTSETPADQA